MADLAAQDEQFERSLPHRNDSASNHRNDDDDDRDDDIINSDDANDDISDGDLDAAVEDDGDDVMDDEFGGGAFADVESEDGTDAGDGTDGDDAKEAAVDDSGALLTSAKEASFAKAFEKILKKPVKTADAVILSGSRSMAKREREEDEDAEAVREARQRRRELRRRGHIEIPQRGSDPQHDAREKAFQRLATRGVVKLFNAVSKAQKDEKATLAATKKAKVAAKVAKTSFLSRLQQPTSAAEPAAAPQRGGSSAAAAAATEMAAWDVLQEGFISAQGGARMKDWDKAVDADATQDMLADQLAADVDDDASDDVADHADDVSDQDGSDSGGDGGW